MMIPSSAPAEADLVEKIAEFVDDPLGFVMFAYPWKERGPLEEYAGPDDWQRELLEDIGREVRKRGFDGLNAVLPIRQAISSGHGIGKSTASAWITNWILSTRPHSQGTVTANTFPQLSSKTWPAILKWTRLSITSHWFEPGTQKICKRRPRAGSSQPRRAGARTPKLSTANMRRDRRPGTCLMKRVRFLTRSGMLPKAG